MDTHHLHDMMHDAVRRGDIPGLVMLVANGEDVYAEALGVVDIDTQRPMRDDAIFRIQSMTKPLTAVATLQLIERGTLALDTRIDRWLPELSERRVLRTPDSDLADTVPARRPILVEDLLTCRSGYGIILDGPSPSPIHQEMIDRGVEPGPEPHGESADEWIAKFRDLPLVHQPGEGWRYHISFDILGVFISRVVERSFPEHLADHVTKPLDMRDTGFWARAGEAERLPAVYAATETGFEEIEPSGGGFYAGKPAFDISHGELVSTARDYHRFAQMLMQGGTLDGVRIVSPDSVDAMVSDQIPASQKTADSFFPGFWDTNGWGYGVSVVTEPGEPGDHAGRYGWDGGLGTSWFNDPSTGTIGIFLAQVLFNPEVISTIGAFRRAVLETGARR